VKLKSTARTDAARNHCRPVANLSNYEAGDIARACRQIEYSQIFTRANPAPQEMADQSMAAKITVQRSQIFQIGNQLWRDRLRPVHPLRLCWIEPPFQGVPRVVTRLSSRSAEGARNCNLRLLTTGRHSLQLRGPSPRFAGSGWQAKSARLGLRITHPRNFCQESGNEAVSTSLAMRPSNSALKEVLVP